VKLKISFTIFFLVRSYCFAITLFFITTIFQEHEAHFYLKFKNKLRTIPASKEEQSLKFLIKVVKKTAAIKCRTIRKMHFASHLFTYNCSSQLREHKQKLYIAYLTSWHNSIFGYTF